VPRVKLLVSTLLSIALSLATTALVLAEPGKPPFPK
jgi:hypothetical protein